MNRDTKRHPPSQPTFNLNCFELTTFTNFHIPKFRISVVWYHLAKYLHHLTCVSKCLPCFSFTQSNLWQDMNLFCSHLVFLYRIDRSPLLVGGVLTWTFQFDLHFCSKISPNLMANWKICGLTKPDYKIINIINHHGNLVIIVYIVKVHK